MKANRITQERGKHCFTAGTRNQVRLCCGGQEHGVAHRSSVENKLRMHVEVAAGNHILCRGNVVSSVYARPFDRMPVKLTHLHSSHSYGSVTFTAVLRSMPTAICLVMPLRHAGKSCTCSYTLERPQVHPLTCHSFVGQDRQVSSCPLQLKEKQTRKKGKNANESSLLSEGDTPTPTHPHAHAHTHRKRYRGSER